MPIYLVSAGPTTRRMRGTSSLDVLSRLIADERRAADKRSRDRAAKRRKGAKARR